MACSPEHLAGPLTHLSSAIHPDDRASVLDTIGKAQTSGADFSIPQSNDLA